MLSSYCCGSFLFFLSINYNWQSGQISWIEIQMLRYHGRWIFTKNARNFFLAVQTEKTEIDILQEEWGKRFFMKIKKKKLFLNIINPLRRVDSSNKNLPSVVTCNANYGVMFHLCMRTNLDLVVSSQVSFRSCQIFFMSGRKRLTHFRLRRNRRDENLVEPTGSASNKIFGSERPWVAL